MIVDFNDKDSIMVCLRNYGLNENVMDLLKYKLEQNSTFLIRHISEILREQPTNITNLVRLVYDIIMDQPDIIKNLNNVEFREFVSVLINLLNFPDEEIRILAAELLFKLDLETAVLFANILSEDISLWNRMKLIELLVDYNSPNAEEILRNMIGDPEEMVSQKALEFDQRNRRI